VYHLLSNYSQSREPFTEVFDKHDWPRVGDEDRKARNLYPHSATRLLFITAKIKLFDLGKPGAKHRG